MARPPRLGLRIEGRFERARHGDGVQLDEEIAHWHRIRACGWVRSRSWTDELALDDGVTFVALQLTDATHHWYSFGHDTGMLEGFEGWLRRQLVPGLDLPDPIGIDWHGDGNEVFWPPYERGQRMYGSRPRRRFGWIPWGSEIFALLQ